MEKRNWENAIGSKNDKNSKRKAKNDKEEDRRKFLKRN